VFLDEALGIRGSRETFSLELLREGFENIISRK
jgi:hypothetical protein